MNYDRVSLGTGLYWHQPKYFVGISSTQLYSSASFISPSFLINGGYLFKLNEALEAIPMLNFYQRNGSSSLEAFCQLWYKNRLGLGLGYANQDEYSAHAQVYVMSNLKAGYQLTVNTSPLTLNTSGTHEFLVSYDLNKRNLEEGEEEKTVFRKF